MKYYYLNYKNSKAKYVPLIIVVTTSNVFFNSEVGTLNVRDVRCRLGIYEPD